MSGLADIRRFLGGYHNETTYYQNPIEFIPNEHDWGRLAQLRNQDVILAVGKGRRADPPEPRAVGEAVG